MTTKAEGLASSVPSPGNGIFGDLSAEDACTVVNWVFDGCGGTPAFDIDIYIEHYLRESDLPNTL
ncbi:MAG: hypothetical protein ACKOI2_01200 [Actinomycetota bacterium]